MNEAIDAVTLVSEAYKQEESDRQTIRQKNMYTQAVLIGISIGSSFAGKKMPTYEDIFESSESGQNQDYVKELLLDFANEANRRRHNGT